MKEIFFEISAMFPSSEEEISSSEECNEKSHKAKKPAIVSLAFVLICAQRPDENKKIKRVYVTF
jgi:hypothetical protein